ncbi:MAG: carboxypeptidase-like regulatory domain-containing protein [Halanaeroarchaeum sp.]
MGKSGIFLTLLLVVGAVGGAVPGVVAAQTTVTLTVSVTTPSGQSVGGATLTATWDGGTTTERTASNGKAFVDVPEGADVDIAVDHPEYVRNAPYHVTEASERDVDITVYDEATATITVEDADGPVDNATVTLTRHGITVVEEKTTDGSVRTGTIEEGEYHVTVEKPGYFGVERDVVVENHTARTLTIERGTVTLEVNVSDDYFDPPRPISGATATVGDVGTIKTQADGVQRISVPVNTQLEVTVSKDGYQSVRRLVQVEESDVTLHVDIARTPTLHADVMSDQVVVGEQVLVTVTDEYGDPVADAAVLVDGERVARTDDDGTATVTIESGGNHSVTVAKHSLTSRAVTVVGVVPGTATTATTSTATSTATTTDTSTPVPGVPGFGVQMGIVGVALVAVLLGIRAWQRG